MKQLTSLLALFICANLWAQVPIFSPTSPIITDGLVNSPVEETVEKVIDGDLEAKYLDFELDDGIGFTVDLQGDLFRAELFEITTGNDFPVRDAMNYQILGSTDGVNFTELTTGTITCIDDRLSTREYDFTNENAYGFYRVILTNACDPSGGSGIPSMQVAEVQLYELLIGFDDNELRENISVIPNPTDGIFRINAANGIEINTIEIFNVIGKQVATISSSKLVDASILPTGIYMARINTNYGSIVKKVVKL